LPAKGDRPLKLLKGFRRRRTSKEHFDWMAVGEWATGCGQEEKMISGTRRKKGHFIKTGVLPAEDNSACGTPPMGKKTSPKKQWGPVWGEELVHGGVGRRGPSENARLDEPAWRNAGDHTTKWERNLEEKNQH